MDALPALSVTTTIWRLIVTLLFVLLNGFFVAAEFSLVKVRGSRVNAAADRGSGAARLVGKMLGSLDVHLSACQLGITVASLILGWLAEPAIATLLIGAFTKLGWGLSAGVSHVIALGLALTIVTTLHMTLGEQAPKIWAIHQPEATAMSCAYPLRLFTVVFGPLIWVINKLSNSLLRVGGITSTDGHDTPFSADELHAVLAASARAGHISGRQREFAENILRFVDRQVRHILVPRVDVVTLSTHTALEENLETIRHCGHSRFPVCGADLDDVKGMIHVKDLLAVLIDKRPIDLSALARSPVIVPDTQPLSRLIVEMQRAHVESALVVDDHGTAVGLAFLEDALEEIVGPIQDEFDDGEEEPPIKRTGPNTVELRGDVALPEATELLDLENTGDDDTIGGYIVSLFRRLPKQGDSVAVGEYQVTVIETSRRRINRLKFEKSVVKEDDVVKKDNS